MTDNFPKINGELLLSLFRIYIGKLKITQRVKDNKIRKDPVFQRQIKISKRCFGSSKNARASSTAPQRDLSLFGPVASLSIKELLPTLKVGIKSLVASPNFSKSKDFETPVKVFITVDRSTSTLFFKSLKTDRDVKNPTISLRKAWSR